MKPSYGTVSQIIPIDRIKKVEVLRDGKEMKRLIVDVYGTHNLEYHYDIDNKKVDDFAGMCNGFIKEG